MTAPQRGARTGEDTRDEVRREYRESGELLGAYGLADAANAQLVRREDGAPAVTDGPYLETKEYMASFYLLELLGERQAAAGSGRQRRTPTGKPPAGPPAPPNAATSPAAPTSSVPGRRLVLGDSCDA
ncbi:YciI family protein [Streptomyces chattanoogensis]|uniref:YciI family protein n=1 Tax=Streptomyces chattanoogensis TaxID=66876 RepID=UPI0036AB17B7